MQQLSFLSDSQPGSQVEPSGLNPQVPSVPFSSTDHESDRLEQVRREIFNLRQKLVDLEDEERRLVDGLMEKNRFNVTALTDFEQAVIYEYNLRIQFARKYIRSRSSVCLDDISCDSILTRILDRYTLVKASKVLNTCSPDIFSRLRSIYSSTDKVGTVKEVSHLMNTDLKTAMYMVNLLSIPGFATQYKIHHGPSLV